VQRFNADGTPFEPSRIYSPNGSVQVQSNEAGAVYLVHDSVKVGKLVDITGTADALWNSVAVKAGTSTALTWLAWPMAATTRMRWTRPEICRRAAPVRSQWTAPALSV
jgi:hypothetical protein